MKVAGLISAILGLLAAVLLLLIPSSVSLLGTDVSCGLPVITVLGHGVTAGDGEFVDSINQACFSQSFIRIIIAAVVGAFGLFGGALMVFLGDRKPGPGMWWDGRGWRQY